MILFLLLLCLTGCVKTTILNAPILKSIDTIDVKTRVDSTEREEPDSTRYPIIWSVSASDWEETETSL